MIVWRKSISALKKVRKRLTSLLLEPTCKHSYSTYYNYCNMINYVIKNYCKKKQNAKNRKFKSKQVEDIRVIDNNLKEIDIKIANKVTLKSHITAFEKITKNLMITEVSDLFPLFTKYLKIIVIDHTNINNFLLK